jgi:hypothetical protein
MPETIAGRISRPFQPPLHQPSENTAGSPSRNCGTMLTVVPAAPGVPWSTWKNAGLESLNAGSLKAALPPKASR